MKAMIKAACVLAIATLLIGLAPRGAWTHAASSRGQVYVYNYENVLGTSLQLKIAASSSSLADKSANAALAEIDRENKILSSWDSHSEFGRWFNSRNEPEAVSPELFEVLGLFDLWRQRTNGALDASAEAVTRVWQKAAAEKRMPTPAELAVAVEQVRRRHWVLDEANRTATHTSDVPLAMNSFVKSYIVEHAANAASGTSGVHGVVVNIGGDLVVRGDLTESVTIADPMSDAENADPIAELAIRDRAVATSGDYRRGFEIGGQHYSHIVDPRTAKPVDEIVSSTVVAPRGSDAGALATAFSVLSPEESKRLAATVPGAEYLLVIADGRQVASAGWSALKTQQPERTPASESMPAGKAPQVRLVTAQSTPPAATWNREYELIINLEIAHIEGDRILRPFVVVWVEDAQKTPIRTIALWYGKFRYLNELHSWYNVESQRPDKEVDYIMNSISSATRPPGKYKLRWDGRDNTGKFVKPGKYTISIEASREHGTYQLMREEMNFKGVPQHFDFPGGVEIASASLDYHKIAH